MTENLLRPRAHRPVRRLRRLLGLSIVPGGLGIGLQPLLDAAVALAAA